MSETPEVILEPGDPGYVAPTTEPSTPAQQEQTDVLAPGPNEGLGAPALPGEDLRAYPEKGESDAEFLARSRNTVVNSQSPTDIVPNTPQISLGNPSPPPAEEVPTQDVAPEGETPLVTETPVVTTPTEETPA